MSSGEAETTEQEVDREQVTLPQITCKRVEHRPSPSLIQDNVHVRQSGQKLPSVEKMLNGVLNDYHLQQPRTKQVCSMYSIAQQDHEVDKSMLWRALGLNPQKLPTEATQPRRRTALFQPGGIVPKERKQGSHQRQASGNAGSISAWQEVTKNSDGLSVPVKPLSQLQRWKQRLESENATKSKMLQLPLKDQVLKSHKWRVQYGQARSRASPRECPSHDAAIRRALRRINATIVEATDLATEQRLKRGQEFLPLGQNINVVNVSPAPEHISCIVGNEVHKPNQPFQCPVPFRGRDGEANQSCMKANAKAKAKEKQEMVSRKDGSLFRALHEDQDEDEDWLDNINNVLSQKYM